MVELCLALGDSEKSFTALAVVGLLSLSAKVSLSPGGRLFGGSALSAPGGPGRCWGLSRGGRGDGPA